MSGPPCRQKYADLLIDQPSGLARPLLLLTFVLNPKTVLLLTVLLWACNSPATAPLEEEGQDLPVPEAETKKPDPSVDPEGWALHYDPNTVLRYDLELPEGTWEAMLADPLSDEYVEGTLRFGDETYERVGVRFKGNSSRWMVQRSGGDRYSIKIKFGEFVEDQTLHGIRKLNLHNAMGDPSYMRERLSYDLFREAGVPSSEVAYANLYLNGELRGLFISVQQVDKRFLKYWVEDKSGNLYKPENGDLLYKGDEIEAYGPEAYELKTNEDLSDYSGLVNFIDLLNNTEEAAFVETIESIFEVDTFLRWLAANTLLVALDSYAGSIPHNYYLYDNPSGRFTYIPWDLNGSFGTFSCFTLSPEQLVGLSIDMPYCTEGSSPDAPPRPVMRPLITRILAVNSYRATYREYLDTLLQGSFSEATIDERINRWHDLINDHVAADPTAFFGHQAFESSLNENVGNRFGLRSFVTMRVAYVRAALAGNAPVCGDGICEPNESCSLDCNEPPEECPPCMVYAPPAGRCVPSCDTGCSCEANFDCHPEHKVCIPR